MAEKEIIPASDFQALPLEMLVATPLVATVKAQAAAAMATLEFIRGLTNPVAAAGGNPSDIRTPQTVVFDLQYQETEGQPPKTTDKHVRLDVPLLSIVPVPHLRIDSMTSHFKYEISQVVADKEAINKGGDLSVGVTWLPFVQATLKGTLASQSSTESTTNRSGVLEITIHASEAPIPEGLARLLSLFAKMSEPKTVA